MRGFVYNKRLLCGLAAAIILACTAHAQVDRARLIAAYLNNFALYTSWPDDYPGEQFIIMVISTDQEVINALQSFAEGRYVKGKPVMIRINRDLTRIADANMVLVTQDQSTDVPYVYDQISQRPILLISEKFPDKRGIMINLYESQERELLFEVNEANIINQGLTVDPEILLAGGTMLDLARLYRESQQELRHINAERIRMADSLQQLSFEIEKRIHDMENLSQEIENQGNLLARRDQELTEYAATINNQIVLLNQQNDSLAAQNEKFVRLQNDIDAQTNAYQSLMAEWNELTATLRERQREMELLDKDIVDKSIVLDEQGTIIERQRYFLWLSIFTALVTLGFVFNIWRGYRRNKMVNKLLSEQRQQIFHKLNELEKLNKKLERADYYKSIFLASMSHELRTPLNSIIGYTGILLMGMAGELNEEQRVQLTKVKNNGSHLLSLINDVLDISKIEAGKVELQLQEFNLNELVNEVVEMVFPRVKEKNLEVLVRVDKSIELKTDRRRLKQVVLNLISNAVNYTEHGHILISAKLRPHDTFRLSVKDTGIGIPPDSIERLFSPFQQIESTLIKKNKGTGLGLYLCKKLLNLMKGDVFVYSEAGKGSNFYIEMPLSLN